MLDDSIYNSNYEQNEKPNPLEAIKSTFGKIGIAPIAIAVLAVIIVIIITSLPKPGSLTIHVTPFDDTSGVADAIVTVLIENSKKPLEEATDSTGAAEFKNLPSDKDLTIEVDAGSEYKLTSVSEKLENSENKEVTIQVPRAIPAVFKQTSITGSISETCVKPVKLEVENKGEDAIELSLSGTGDLTHVKTETQVIGSQSSVEFIALIDASKTGKKKGSQIKGAIRIKGTNTKTDLDFKVDESVKIDVSPSSLNCAVGKNCQQIVTVKNTGSTTLENYAVELSESLTSTVQKSDFDSLQKIPPNGESKFGVTMNPTANIIGIITITGDCYSKKIDVKTT